jgi:hypothetical protein
MVAQRPLHLCGLPIALSRAAQDHVDGMIAAAESALANGAAGLTTSLALTVKSLSEEYSDLSAGTESLVEAAEASGQETVDLQFEAPLTMASAAETWLRLLEHLEDLAVSGEFDYQPAPAEVAAYRTWLVDEIVDQLRQGRAPVAFADATAPAEG